MLTMNNTLENSATLQDLFVLDGVIIEPASEHSVLMSNAKTGSALEIHVMMSNLVSHCRNFRTINEHAAHIQQAFNLPADITLELNNTLGLLKKYGMLLSAQDLKNELSAGGTEYNTESHTSWILGIHSCDRPESLKKMLDSTRKHLTTLDNKPTVIFVDDSRDSGNKAINKNAIASLCLDLDLNHSYWDRADRQAYCRSLCSQHPELTDSIKWLLDPLTHNPNVISTGLAKNFIQLQAINKKVIMIDDDCFIDPIQTVGTQPGSTLKSNQDILQVFEGHSTLDSRTAALDINPFLEHLAALGSKPARHFSNHNELNVTTWKGSTAQEMRSFHHQNSIGLTVNSIAGAQNSRHMEFIYSNLNMAEQTEAFLLSAEHAPQIKQLTWSGPKQNTISKFAAFICTTMSGLNASQLPAPTTPTGRNQDIFLGLMATYLSPQCLTMKFNWGMLHDPLPTRTWDPNQAPTSVAYSPIVILRRLLEDCCLSCNLEQPIDRLNYYLDTLDQVILKNEYDLDKFITEQVTAYFSSELQFFNNIQQQSQHLPRYQAGVKSIISNKKMEMVKLIKEPLSLKNDFTTLTRSLIAAFRDWPAIIQLVTCEHQTTATIN